MTHLVIALFIDTFAFSRPVFLLLNIALPAFFVDLLLPLLLASFIFDFGIKASQNALSGGELDWIYIFVEAQS